MITVLHHKALFRLLITGVKKGRLHCWTSRRLRSSGVPWFQGPKRRVYHRSTGAKGSPWISWRKRRYSKNHCKKFRSTLMKVHRPHEWSNEKDCWWCRLKACVEVILRVKLLGYEYEDDLRTGRSNRHQFLLRSASFPNWNCRTGNPMFFLWWQKSRLAHRWSCFHLVHGLRWKSRHIRLFLNK